MSIDVRQVVVGTTLLLASSLLFLTTGVDHRVAALLALTAAGAAAVGLVRLFGATGGRAA